MDFDLSDELAELQATCRRIAQDKVKPRAREIDESGEYPQDIFEVFRDAGLLGLCIPTELGGSGAGILGLTIAIEEVEQAKAICAQCAVRQACLEHALASRERDGIWGGATEKERRRIIRQRRRTA